MKQLNENKKKWALTACLAAVLSFNFIMGSQEVPFYTADLAATSPEEKTDSANAEDVGDLKDVKDVGGSTVRLKKQTGQVKFAEIITKDGKLPIMYLPKGSKTLAILPKEVEGEFCWYKCGEEYLLPVNFKSNTEDLELAFRKVEASSVVETDEEEEDLDDKIERRKKKLEEVADNEETDEEEEEEKIHKDLLALEKKCEDKEDDSRTECFANGLTSLLKNTKKNKKKELPKDQVLALYKKEIEPGLLDTLSDVRNADRREEGQVILEDMLGSIAKKYEYLRVSLVKLSALVVINAQKTAQTRFRQAEQLKSTNPYQALRLQADGFNRRSQAEYMAMNLDYTLQSGLESAQFNRLIDENRVVDLYTNQYIEVVNPIIQGMRQNPLGYTISSSLIADGTGLLFDTSGNSLINPSAGPISELRSMGRGVQVFNNGLTSVNTMPAGAPRIVTTGTAAPGSAVIQVIPASQIPANINHMVAPSIRGRQ